MAYAIHFQGDTLMQSNGSIFEMEGHIFLCGNGLVVRVQSAVYHQRMLDWVNNRMPHPLVFVEGDNRCTMRACDDGAVQVVLEAIEVEVFKRDNVALLPL